MSKFMWSINHNVSNTDAHYSVHREAMIASQQLKGISIMVHTL